MEVDFCNKRCCDKSIQGNVKDIKLLKELKRRVVITCRTRINAANRLRNQHNEYKKLNIYYSALVTGASILTIGIDTKIRGIPVSNIVLMVSIVLTYFMFYVSEQNLQERAYRMEDTFKSLDKLSNKISILLEDNQVYITDKLCEKLYKEYEVILSRIENHEEIDYDMYRLSNFKKVGIAEMDREEYLEVEKRVKRYKLWKKIEVTLWYIVPIILTAVLLANLK